MAYTKGVIVIIIFAWIIVRVKMEFSVCRTARSERKGVRCAFSIRIDTEGMPFEAIFVFLLDHLFLSMKLNRRESRQQVRQ